MDIEKRLMEIYCSLRGSYGPRMWWPVTPSGGISPEYTGGPVSAAQRFEVAVGAVLTQNTAWKNAAAAIENLNREGLLSPEKLKGIAEKELAGIIRPSGYYNMKAKKLKVLAGFFSGGHRVTRESLLALYGIGPETADSILLYAFGRPEFVVDAYTKRILSRLALAEEYDPYAEVKRLFEENLPADPPLFQEYHALLVEHAKRHCRKNPLCAGCPISGLCSLTM
jgi:endonuclease-3 related protein